MLKIKSFDVSRSYNENDKKDILHLYEKFNSDTSIFFNFIKKKPHSIYVFSKLIKLIQSDKKNLNFTKTICIGSDFIKEYLSVKFLFDKIDCIDIDQSLVEDHKHLAKKFDLKIDYKKANVLNYNLDKYDTLLLYQMDYIFSNNQLSQIIKNFSVDPGKRIILMSPSIFNNDIKTNPLILFFNLMSFFFYTIKKIKIDLFSLFSKKNYYFTYKRSSRELISIFKKEKFDVEKKDFFLINNQNYSLFLFKSKK